MAKRPVLVCAHERGSGRPTKTRCRLKVGQAASEESVVNMNRCRRAGFTLIELLVVIAIIALLIGILLPALGKARATARKAADLSNIRSMGLMMTLYANEANDWFPVLPTPGDNRNVYADQHKMGGVAGLFSHWQVGTDDGTMESPEGWSRLGGTPDHSRNWAGNPNPIMSSYMDTLDVLTSPAQKEDYDYHGPPIINASSISSINVGRPVQPQTPANEFEVISYNISYLYLSGLRSIEPAVTYPVPLWGTETVGPDIGTAAWYGGGTGSGSSPLADSAGTRPGYYSKFDTFGDTGGNFVFSDGHAKFLKNEQMYKNIKISIHDLFFSSTATRPDLRGNPQSINAHKKNRSVFLQTID